LVEKALNDVTETSCDPAAISVIKNLGEAVKLLATNQTTIANHIFSPPAPPPPSQQAWIPVVNSYAAAAHKKSRYESSQPSSHTLSVPNSMVTLPGTRTLRNRPVPVSGSSTAPGAGSGSGAGPNTNSNKPSDPPEIKQFKDAIREAEKSTLIFNLDMGKIPVLNTETISKRATLALTTMAAKTEKSKTSVPSADAVSAIDDVLSVTKGMCFFGRATKTYSNAKDSASGSFCTVPVKYDFKDRETRIQAESILRKTCNVNCSTPYPPPLRECIKQTTTYFQNKTGSNFVRVSVDIGKLCLKAQTKRNKDDRWTWIEESIRIPPAVITNTSRRLPVGFKMEFIPLESGPDAAAMDTGDTDGAVGGTAADAASSPSKRKPSQSSSRNAAPLEPY
jgi:hypothetical protein